MTVLLVSVLSLKWIGDLSSGYLASNPTTPGTGSISPATLEKMKQIWRTDRWIQLNTD